MRAVKDKDLLRRAHAVWDDWGCSLCGRHPVYLHHIEYRSQGGGDTVENLLGVCEACHEQLHRRVFALKRNAANVLVWCDTRQGSAGWQPVRLPPGHEALSPSDPPDPIPSTPETASQEVERTPEEVLDSLAGTPERLLAAIKQHAWRSNMHTLSAAYYLALALEHAHHEKLGMSWPEYYTEAGFDKWQVSRMLTVVAVFPREMVADLTDADRQRLNLDRLYVAARQVKGGKPAEDALQSAVTTPTHHMIAELKGEEPTDRCSHHVCPDCGAEIWHNRREGS